MVAAWVLGMVLYAAPPRVEVALADAKADDKEGVLGQMPFPGKQGKKQLVVIRSAKDFMAMVNPGGAAPADIEKIEAVFVKQLAKQLKYDKFDFSKNMLVLVSSPPKSAPGTSVEITSAKVEGKKLVIRWKEVAAAPGKPAVGATMAAVEKFDGDVVIDPPTGEEKKEEEKKDR